MIRELERRFALIANRRGLAIVVVGLAALLGTMIPYLIYAISSGVFSSWSFLTAYDEYSYLLAADTFASGRLTNPTHPMWRHFVTHTVIHQPTYQSIYAPGQGMFLAMGRLLTGYPIAGVWISMALAGSAVCYLLQGWFPPRWALLGGLLAALHARMALEWGGTYWGGGVPMLGGALVFGGLRRLLNQPRIGDSFLLALGLAILANSRPFEGLVASTPAAVMLTGWLVADNGLPLRCRMMRVVAPILGVLGVSATCISYYNYRLTGSPWTLPYLTYNAQLGQSPFIWQPSDSGSEVESTTSLDRGVARELSDPHLELIPVETLWRDEEWWVAAYVGLHANPSLTVASAFKLAILWFFYVGPVLSVPLLALPWAVRDRWTWFALSTVGLTLLAVLTTVGAYPHYLAPVAPLVFVLVVRGTRSLSMWRRRGSRIGRYCVPTIVLLWILQLILAVGIYPPLTAAARWGEPRAKLLTQLERMDGDHLVIVRYMPGHVFYQEWVYNEADIDGAKVVWARELSPDSNRQLLAYFHDRQVWLVEPDRNPPTLVPYDTGIGMDAPEVTSHGVGLLLP